MSDIAIMSIQDMISIVNKSDTNDMADSQKKVHQDLFNELKDNVERISLKFLNPPYTCSQCG